MKYSQKGIPKELKPVADREERSLMHVYNTKQKIMLFFYMDKKKKWWGKCNFIVNYAWSCQNHEKPAEET